jgi:serine/alanine adding enzyme
MKVITNEDINPQEWNRFVHENKRGNIFQTYEFYQIFKKTKRVKPLLIIVINENKKILAGLLAYFSTEKPVIFSFLSCRAVIHGGPLYEDSTEGKKALSVLMKEFENRASKKALFAQIRNINEAPKMTDILQKHNYVYEPHLNFLVDLTKSKEELWQAMTKARRNGITKSKRFGVEVEEVNNVKFIPTCYELLQQTYSHARLPLADISIFRNVFEILHSRSMIKIFTAVHEGKKIGVIIILLYKGMIYDWYAGASSDNLRLCQNDLLPWYVIEWGCKNNFKVFDFGGAGHPDKPYGVREFKRQFGGREVNFGRYEKVYSPRKLSIAKRGFDVYRRLLLK